MSRARAGGVEFDDAVLLPYRERLARLGDAPPVRRAFAAAHVVMRPDYATSAHRLDAPGSAEQIAEAIDWPRTAALRRHLAAQGFGIAEAMDTAQRFQLGFPAARRLIADCRDACADQGFIAGAATDHCPEADDRAALIHAVVEQIRFIQAAGGLAIVLPLAFLPRSNATAADYVETYDAIADAIDGPLFLHWLGEAFAPHLRGYFPDDSLLTILRHWPDKIRGVKLSILDADRECRLRADLQARDQIVLTGDDFHFAGLIEGADWRPRRHASLGGRPLPLGPFSHALLGVFDAIAVPAGVALRLLAHGDVQGYREVMRACERLGQVIFEPDTGHYKAGLAFLAYLNGHQDQFLLVNHQQRHRGRDHYLRVAALASPAGAIDDAQVAASRLQAWLDGAPVA